MIEKYWTHTPTRCPIDDQLTTLDAIVHADTVPLAHRFWRSEAGANRSLGTVLGCGHVLDSDRWAWRFDIVDGVWMGWWADVMFKSTTVPEDAVALRTPAQDVS